MMKGLTMTLVVLAAALTACNQKEQTSAPAAPATPSIPTLDVSALTDLSKNERQELERRCLGVDHATCRNLKSDEYQTLMTFKKSLCKTGAAVDGLSSSAKGREAERKCDDL